MSLKLRSPAHAFPTRTNARCKLEKPATPLLRLSRTTRPLVPGVKAAAPVTRVGIRTSRVRTQRELQQTPPSAWSRSTATLPRKRVAATIAPRTSPPAERSTPGILLIAFRERSHHSSAGRTIPLDGTRSRGRGHRDDSFSSRAGLQTGSAMATEHRSASASPAIPLPRTRSSYRGWASDCIARMMRKSNHARPPSDAALLLL